MPRHQAAPDPNQGPIAEFAYLLYMLRASFGEPSYREMATTTHFSHTSLSRAAQGRVLPSWEVTEAFVRYCGADNLAAWRGRWELARDARDRENAHPVAATPATAPTELPEPDRARPTPPVQGIVLARVAVVPRTQQRRVYGTSMRPAGAHRAPGAHRRRDGGPDPHQASRPKPANENRRAVIFTLVLLALLALGALAFVVTI
jgi:hypothetical protein